MVDVAASTTTTHTAENVAMMTIGVSDQLTIVTAESCRPQAAPATEMSGPPATAAGEAPHGAAQRDTAIGMSVLRARCTGTRPVEIGSSPVAEPDEVVHGAARLRVAERGDPLGLTSERVRRSRLIGPGVADEVGDVADDGAAETDVERILGG